MSSVSSTINLINRAFRLNTKITTKCLEVGNKKAFITTCSTTKYLSVLKRKKYNRNLFFSQIFLATSMTVPQSIRQLSSSSSRLSPGMNPISVNYVQKNFDDYKDPTSMWYITAVSQSS